MAQDMIRSIAARVSVAALARAFFVKQFLETLIRKVIAQAPTHALARQYWTVQYAQELQEPAAITPELHALEPAQANALLAIQPARRLHQGRKQQIATIAS